MLGGHEAKGPPSAAWSPDILTWALQHGVGGQLRIEHQMRWWFATGSFPEIDELRDFLSGPVLANGGVGVAEYPRIVVLGQKRQDGLFASAAFRDVVFVSSPR